MSFLEEVIRSKFNGMAGQRKASSQLPGIFLGDF
jgi:hypothetical protein